MRINTRNIINVNFVLNGHRKVNLALSTVILIHSHRSISACCNRVRKRLIWDPYRASKSSNCLLFSCRSLRYSYPFDYCESTVRCACRRTAVYRHYCYYYYSYNPFENLFRKLVLFLSSNSSRIV